MEDLKFSLKLEERPVEIDGDKYVLRELDGQQRDKYLNSLGKRLVSTGKGKDATQTVKNFDGLQATLVGMCLYKQGEENPVPVDTIQSWPASVVSDLHDAAKELSKLGDEDEEGKD